jgi:DNA-binding beta-propeller fold protein YncE
MVSECVYETSTGIELWTTRYTGPGDNADIATALGVSPDGSTVFVTGSSDASENDADYATVAYDAVTGSELWVSRHSGERNERAVAVGVSPDGSSVFVTGRSTSSGITLYVTVAYDAATGTELWSMSYGSGSGKSDRPHAIGVSADGSAVFVTGRSGPGPYDYATVVYDAATGSELWAKRYDGGGEDVAEALGVSADGSLVFVTGRSVGRTSRDYVTVAYRSSNGAELWVSRYDGPVHGSERPSALAVSADGSALFVTGRSDGATRRPDYTTVAYEASTGSQVWVGRYDGPGNDADRPSDVGVSPDSSTVFVTGRSFGSTSRQDYATVAYDASSGSPIWVSRKDGPGHINDVARALEVSPDGSAMFVTGQMRGSTRTSTTSPWPTESHDHVNLDFRLMTDRVDRRGARELALWLIVAALDVLLPLTTHWWESHPRWWRSE